ncbi:hypothetical protein QJU11_10095 [Pasteurella atlantica]|uniref:hypothetical protein n=1 Tax=Phocoenobacter atlanticus TaxID=3416742 RepID=UPI00275796A3|nr:hypothetical protein [Pasteurella atlantica]MDP8042542.1 hypothetical protein [Pasteurella atlantica]
MKIISSESNQTLAIQLILAESKRKKGLPFYSVRIKATEMVKVLKIAVELQETLSSLSDEEKDYLIK